MGDTSRDRPPAQFSLYLPAEMVDEIDAICEERLSSRAGVIREALAEWLARRRRLAELADSVAV